MAAEENEVRLGFGHFERLALVGLLLEPCGGGVAGFAQVRHAAQLFVGVFDAARAAAWVTADRWYGMRTMRTQSMMPLLAAR